jgi:hypothetical protein
VALSQERGRHMTANESICSEDYATFHGFLASAVQPKPPLFDTSCVHLKVARPLEHGATANSRGLPALPS